MGRFWLFAWPIDIIARSPYRDPDAFARFCVAGNYTGWERLVIVGFYLKPAPEMLTAQGLVDGAIHIAAASSAGILSHSSVAVINHPQGILMGKAGEGCRFARGWPVSESPCDIIFFALGLADNIAILLLGRSATLCSSSQKSAVPFRIARIDGALACSRYCSPSVLSRR
jgi:hypothetical protein